MGTKARLGTLFALVALLALGGAVGCGDDDGDDAEPSPPPTEEQTTGDQTNGLSPDDLPQGNANAGEQVFADNCSSCHGPDGGGSTAGPGLTETGLDRTGVAEQVINGGGGMPAFGDELSEQEISDVASYVTEQIADG